MVTTDQGKLSYEINIRTGPLILILFSKLCWMSFYRDSKEKYPAPWFVCFFLIDKQYPNTDYIVLL